MILLVNRRFLYLILLGALACTALPKVDLSYEANANLILERVQPPSQKAPSFDPQLIPYSKFSDYDLFEGPIAGFQPSKGVQLYRPANELFSDYASKLRFIKVPEGERITWDESGNFEFPLHTLLIKHFLYPDVAQLLKGPVQMMESRILHLSNDGWKAYTYVWNDKGTEAFLNQVGDFKSVNYTHFDGKKMDIAYVVPNKNECKNCHQRSNEMVPLGPTPEHLQYSWKDSGISQLERWVELGILERPETGFSHLSSPVLWNDSSTGAIHERALAYLEANCGHCHHPEGSAHTSGLFLQLDQKDPRRLGILKPPVAAGKGSGNRKYSIEPGHPENSILLYRMTTNEPGEMMPELGRSVIHQEGIEVIREWIESMSTELDN